MLDEEVVCLELVRHASAHLGLGQEHERRRERGPLAREDGEVEVVQRNDEPHVVLADEVGERRHVGGVGDARHDRTEVRVVERGREGIGIDGQRDCSRTTKRADDVDALTRAREEDDHDRRAYSELTSPSVPAPIRILRVIARLNMGGPAIHVTNLAAGLETRGYHTTLVAGSLPRGEDSMAFVADELGVTVMNVPEIQREVSPLHDTRAVRRLTSVIRAERPHILHTHTAKAGAIARAAALLAGDARPPIVVHTFHGHVFKGYFGPGRTEFFRQVERTLARYSDVLVAVSPEVRDELVAHGIAPFEKFAVIRLGIPLEQRLDDPERLDFRALYGIPDAAFVVGWVGRMTGVKDTGAVLEIVRAARERGVDAVACMVGDGPDREPLEELAHELGIARSTYFVGYQPDVAGYYRLFDAFLLPSVNEGTPVSAIEALASGTPVVATRVGGVPDVVRDGLDGFLVEPGDVEGAAERLATLASDPELRRRLGASGSAYVRERYSVSRLVDDVDMLYRSLLASKGIG